MPFPNSFIFSINLSCFAQFLTGSGVICIGFDKDYSGKTWKMMNGMVGRLETEVRHLLKQRRGIGVQGGEEEELSYR